MPGKVQIVLEAQTDEALGQIQKFARGTQDAFDKVRAGDPALQSASASVRSLGGSVAGAAVDTEKFGVSITQAHGSSLLFREGVAKMAEQVVPGFGRGILQATTHMEAMALGMLAIISAGAALINHIHAEGNAWSELSAKIQQVNIDIAARVQKTDAEIKESHAKARGDEVGAADQALRASLTASGEARDKRIADAEEAARKISASWWNQVTDALGVSDTIKRASEQLGVDRLQAEATDALEREKAEQSHADRLVDLERAKNARLKTIDDERLASQQTAAAQIEALQAGLSGNRPGQTDAEFKQAMVEAAASRNQAILKANDELRGQQDVLTAELARIWSKYNDDVAVAWEQSTVKMTAISRQLPAELSASLKDLEGPVDRLREKLDLSAAMEAARSDFAKWAEGVKLGIVPASDAIDVIQRKMRDLLQMPGATTQGVEGLMPTGLKEAAADLDRVANAAVRVGDSFAQTAEQATKLDRASRGLEDTLTGHSVDKSLAKVRQESDWAHDSMSTLGQAVDAAERSFYRLESERLAAYNRFPAGMQRQPVAPVSYVPSASSDLFAFPMAGAGPQPLSQGRTMGPYQLRTPDISEFLQAIFQRIHGETPGEPIHTMGSMTTAGPAVQVGDVFGLPVFKDAYVGLKEAAAELKAAAQAQKMTAEWTANVLAEPASAGAGGSMTDLYRRRAI